MLVNIEFVFLLTADGSITNIISFFNILIDEQNMTYKLEINKLIELIKQNSNKNYYKWNTLIYFYLI
jgi:hypothetical protein